MIIITVFSSIVGVYISLFLFLLHILMHLSHFLRIVYIIFPLMCFTIHAKCNHDKASYLLGINLSVNSPVVICNSLYYHSIPRRSRS